MQRKLVIAGLIIGFFTMLTSCNNPEGTQEASTEKLEKKEEKADDAEEKEASEESDQMKVAVITGDGFQDAEAYMPIGYLADRGISSCVIGIEKGKAESYNSDFTIQIHKPIGKVSVDDYKALIIPGGKAPGKLRENDQIVSFAKKFLESGKPVAAICHGPQILITANVMEGKTATAYNEVKSEMKEAGVNFKDEALVIDDNLITSRNPGDLDKFSKAIYKKIKKSHDCDK